MNLRIRFSRFLLQLGSFVESLPVAVMKPDDLIEFSRQTYMKQQNVNSFSEDSFIDQGLSADEVSLLKVLPSTQGDLLLLGIGGGREAIPLARMGFRVTGVDYVDSMVTQAKKNASVRGINIDCLVQDISRLSIPKNSFDVVWLSSGMYSLIPTKVRRVEMIRNINLSLKPGGFFLCQFHWNPNRVKSRVGEFLRRIISILSLGNLGYEEGDILWRNAEFLHLFSSENTIRTELEMGGLSVLHLQINKSLVSGNVVCRKHL